MSSLSVTVRCSLTISLSAGKVSSARAGWTTAAAMANPAISERASRRVAMSSLTSVRTGAFKVVVENAEAAGMMKVTTATESFILDDDMLFLFYYWWIYGEIR
eukprot:732642_1